MIPAGFDGSIALMRRMQSDVSTWLVRWDQPREEFGFVIANRLQAESYRECLSREVAWVLDLERDRDYLVSSVARLHYTMDTATVEFYVVEPYGKRVDQKLDDNPDTTWVRRHELVNRQTDDGRAINKELCELLFTADVIPYDQPT